MFRVRFAAREDGALVTKELVLDPQPKEVDYPDGRALNKQTTQDGAVVVQRPLRGHRPRQWVWRNMPKSYPAYATLWATLEQMEYRTRIANALPGSVEIWEDESGTGGFDRTDASGNRIYTRVKCLQVSRATRKGGGPVIYDHSTIEFVIDDPSYTAF